MNRYFLSFFRKGYHVVSGLSKKGFTMIELIVSMGIMLVVLSVVLADYPESNVRITLANLTHETSLALRETQLRGSSVDSQDLTIGGYGTFFSLASTSQFVLFSDIATVTGPLGLPIGDGFYTSLPGSNETRSVTKYPTGFKINKLCAGTGYPFTLAHGGSCNKDAANTYPIINTLTISFTRPKPRPNITINQLTGTQVSSIGGACIELVSISGGGFGHVRSVQVYTTGRILTSDVGCQ
jgi:prepilin-type N-terminal cleavage/methylation domain-containing protein